MLALSGAVLAEVPRKAPPARYQALWTQSPFTSKPPEPEGQVENNPLDDYALIGVSPIENAGYRVTLINRKKPEDRIVVHSGSIKDGFSVIGVDRKPGNPLGTVVRMKNGSKSGTVSFDEKLLTLVAAPITQPQVKPGQPGQPPIPGQAPQRQPRPRIVPPPNTQPAVQTPAARPTNQRQERRRN